MSCSTIRSSYYPTSVLQICMHYIQLCVHVCICVHMCVCACACACVCVRVCTHTRVCVCVWSGWGIWRGATEEWRDLVKADFQMTRISDTWYTLAFHRNQCVSLYAERVYSSQHLSRETLSTVQCMVCGRTFCRMQDIARHDCTKKQLKPN